MRTGSKEGSTDPPGAEASAWDFDGFFHQQFPVVARTLTLIVHDFETAQDVAQESFARLYARWEGIETWEHARNFVFRVAINLARSHLRRQRLRAAPRWGHLGETVSADEASAVADRVTLGAALAGLSGHQRACLALVDYAGLDVGTTARFLRMRPSTVRVHLTRGRRALAAALRSTYQERSGDD